MASLLGRAPKDSFQELLKLNNTGAGLDATLRAVQDGTGNSSPLQLSTTQIALNGALWPTSLGTSGQFLQMGANGTMSWSSIAAVNSAVITTALGYTPVNPTALTSYAPLAAPAFTGAPTAPTATAGTNTTQLATTAFVTTAVPTNTNQLTNGAGFITSAGAPVQTVAGRTGAVVLSTTDISGIGSYATLASPALSGSPTAPTASAATNTTQIATTAFVQTAVSGVTGSAANSSIVSASVGAGYNIGTATNVFYNLTNISTGAVLTPAANTLAQGWTTTIYINAGTSTSALTTLASNGGSDFFIITGNGSSGVSMLLGYAYKLTAIPSLNRFMVDVAESLGSADVTKALGYTPVNPATAALTGTPTAPTATAGTNTTQLATTAFVGAAITASAPNLSSYAPLASPALTGTPTAPTATAGTNTTQVASTAFVTSAVAGVSGGKYSFNTTVVNTFNIAMGSMYNATLAGFTGTLPAVSGATQGVYATVVNSASSGNITIATTGSDKLGGYFTGSGVATMTLLPGESATFVALPASALWDVINYTKITVNSFNTRTGAVTLTSSDVTGALTYTPANLVSPAFTGTPTAPTATSTDNSTTIATTAFVKTAVASSGVASFNTRTGAVTLTSSDVTTALGSTSTITAVDYETGVLSFADVAGGDPSFASVTALSHFEGIATNATSFSDVLSNTWTVVSGPTFSTAQAKFGTESVLFNGSGALTSANSLINFVGSDFTAEGWFYPTVNSSPFKGLICCGNNFQLFQTNLNLQFVASSNNTTSNYFVNITTSTSPLTLNTWSHVAVTRSGSTFTVWVNGVSVGTASSATALGTSTSFSVIGNFTSDNSTYSYPFSGYIDEVRITKGVGRYTTTFVPPSSAFPNSAGAASYGRLGFRSTGSLQIGSTTGASNAGFSQIGQIDSTGLNGMVIGATTPAAGTFTTLTANTATAGTNTTQVATTAFVKTAITNAIPSGTIVTATATSGGYTLGTTNGVFYNITQAASGLVLLPGLATVSQGWTATLYYNPGSTGTTMTLGANNSPQDYIIQNGNASSNTTLNVGYGYTITAIPSMNRWLVTKSI
jgi:Concanavalin A-like lectin/glucanases superfamily